MQHDSDPKAEILQNIGSTDGLDIFHNQILCVVYMRPEKTKGGIVLPTQHRDEDRHQSKVGLIIKMGPDAFVDETGTWFKGVEVKMHDWIVFRPSDGWSITVNGVLCRILKDESIRGRVSHPDQVW